VRFRFLAGYLLGVIAMWDWDLWDGPSLVKAGILLVSYIVIEKLAERIFDG
jgi:hypothetical protein